MSLIENNKITLLIKNINKPIEGLITEDKHPILTIGKLPTSILKLFPISQSNNGIKFPIKPFLTLSIPNPNKR